METKLNMKKGFVDREGRFFDHVLSIDYKEVGPLTEINLSHNDYIYDFYGDMDNIIKYIYRSKIDPNVCVRYYGDYGYALMPYSDGIFLHEDDMRMVDALQRRQSLVKKTVFPFGVLTCNNKIVGQLSYYVDNATTLLDFVKSGKCSKMNLLLIYKELVTVLKEMIDADICYSDVHGKNVMVDNTSNKPLLIDFDSAYVYFGRSICLSTAIGNYIDMVNKFNAMLGLDTDLGVWKKPESYDSAYDQACSMIRKLENKR